MKRKIWGYLSLYSFIMLLALAYLFIAFFFHAYFSGNYTATIDINRFGEAHFEAVFLGLLAITGFITIYKLIRR